MMNISPEEIFVQSSSSKYKLGHTVICDTSYNTQIWDYFNDKENTKYRASRAGDSIRFEGCSNGEIVKKTIPIVSKLWYQFLGFSLSHFANSGESEIKFVFIRPENLKLYTMLATNQGAEEISINGETVSAVRIRVSLTGVLSYLGGVNFWFRESDYIFVKFEGLSLPWTSRMIYTLAESNLAE